VTPQLKNTEPSAGNALPAATGGRVKILLVDDQPENLLSAEAVLESLGQQIIKAESGREALRHLLQHDFAVILLDIMMPGMDGFETATLVRQRDRSRDTPIIFLTALGRSDEHIRQGYDLGAVDYMLKPFVPEILRSKVSVFVELNRKSQLLQHQSELLERRNVELVEAIHRSQRAEEEIKALNRHLEYRLDELAEVNRELEAFSFSVSHDLRGPLSRISGFSQALRESNAERIDEQGLTYLERIESSSRRMSTLVEDLLNFSRLTRVEMRFSAVDLSAVMRSLAADLKSRDPGRIAEFAIAEGATAWGDPELLRAVMQNLLENAWKFTRKHESARIEFGITNSAPSGGPGPVYYVRDDGAGFDMERRDRLFSPFKRLHESKEFEGTGIGLATVDRIIRRHGGRIWAESEVERGATFFFTLNREGGQ
jgi:two-component system, sensor histidine kinase and response regulator